MAGSTRTIYNTTDGPLPYDRAGRILGARERLEVDSVDGSPLAGHIRAGRILVLDEQQEQRDEQGDAPATPSEEAPRKGGRRNPTTQEA